MTKFLVNFLIKYSFGLVKNEDHARIFIIVVSILGVYFSYFWYDSHHQQIDQKYVFNPTQVTGNDAEHLIGKETNNKKVNNANSEKGDQHDVSQKLSASTLSSSPETFQQSKQSQPVQPAPVQAEVPPVIDQAPAAIREEINKNIKDEINSEEESSLQRSRSVLKAKGLLTKSWKFHKQRLPNGRQIASLSVEGQDGQEMQGSPIREIKSEQQQMQTESRQTDSPAEQIDNLKSYYLYVETKGNLFKLRLIVSPQEIPRWNIKNRKTKKYLTAMNAHIEFANREIATDQIQENQPKSTAATSMEGSAVYALTEGQSVSFLVAPERSSEDNDSPQGYKKIGYLLGARSENSDIKNNKVLSLRITEAKN